MHIIVVYNILTVVDILILISCGIHVYGYMYIVIAHDDTLTLA